MPRPLPPPHIQPVSSTRSEWRASSANRNVSSPFSLAIPPHSQRRTTRERADTPTSYLDLPISAPDTRGAAYLDVPQSPKKAVTVTERPVRARPYTLNGASTSTMLSQYKEEEEEKKKRVNDHVLAFSVTFAIALVLAIALPLAAILPQKYIKPLPISVLMPLYIDPIQNSWERVYDAILKYHDTQFTFIISPSPGPGSTAWPSATYIAAIKQLTAHANVRVLGYIDAAHGATLDTSITSQIATYAGWKGVSAGLALHGIYFDRTPWEDDDDGSARRYVADVSDSVGKVEGWAGAGDAVVVHGPGRVPDRGVVAAWRPDLVVVYEGTWNGTLKAGEMHEWVKGVGLARGEVGMLVNAVPKGLSQGALRRIVEEARRDVEWLYVTDLLDDAYTEYGSLLERWLSVAW